MRVQIYLNREVFQILILCTPITLIGLYTSSLIGVENEVKQCLNILDDRLKAGGFKAKYFVISGRRWKLDNYLLNKFGGASRNSQHLRGKAIDIIVLDINQDGICDTKDVDVIYKIMDREIIKDRGGLGTYKNQSGFNPEHKLHTFLQNILLQNIWRRGKSLCIPSWVTPGFRTVYFRLSA